MCFSTVSQGGRFRFRFRFLENGSGGSGSAFSSFETGSDGSGFRFRFPVPVRFLGHPVAKTAKKAILAISVWRACMPQWTANLTILARNSRKDSKARSAANQPLPVDWHFCKCGLVIPRWLPTKFAQALAEESGEQDRKGDFGDHKIPSPPFTKPPLYPAPILPRLT